MLAYDQRMLLHRDESARGSPHPERPDRIRAVMARLDRAGLTGAASLFCSCSPLSSPRFASHQGSCHAPGDSSQLSTGARSCGTFRRHTLAITL